MGQFIVLVSASGYGIKFRAEDFRAQARGGKGMIGMKTSDRNGPVEAVVPCSDDDHLILITFKGIIIRMKASDIRETARGGMGVRLLDIQDGDAIAGAVAIPAPVSGEGHKVIDHIGQDSQQIDGQQG